jgi:hypothetical protein
MEKQRTLFYGRVPAKTPSKRGANRPVRDRRLGRMRPGQVEVRFTNTTVTQFGGYPVWAKFCDQIGLSAKLAHHIKMQRGGGFTAPELSRFFVDTRLLGAGRLMHVDAMRHDPVLTRSYGIEGLPSDETLGRYFKAYGHGHLAALDRLNVGLNNQQWNKARRQGVQAAVKGDVILDYDSSTMTVYGKQHGADRGRCFRKKDKPGYQPKFAFIGGLGIMVNQSLYPQSWGLAKDFEQFHADTQRKLPKRARIWAVRADTALYSERRLEWFENKGYVYAVGAPVNAPLRWAMQSLAESDWEEGIDPNGHPYSIARIRYRPKTWKKARTFILSRRLRDLKGQTVLWECAQYRYFAHVTNLEGTVLEQFRFCAERCTLEGFIKEGKHGFRYDFLPFQGLDANRAYLAHVQMAYNLAIWWKLLRAPAGVNRWTIATVRRRILNVCGNLRRCGKRWVLSLPKWWPWQAAYAQLVLSHGLSPP